MGDTYNNFTQEQLQEAFNRVRNPKDWKAPIDAVVRCQDLELIGAAVQYFTATTITILERKAWLCRIAADGYRAGPAGDH